MLEDIQKIIERSVPDSKAYVVDPMCDGRHLKAVVISPAFKDISLVKQHHMVMKPLNEALSGRLHALGLKTFTPEKSYVSNKKGGFASPPRLFRFSRK
mgnify:CR=1 FL=1